MFEKHLWKSEILSKDAVRWYFTQNVTLPQVFFKHFGSKNQLPSFYISWTLVGNGLILEMNFVDDHYAFSKWLKKQLNPLATNVPIT